MHYYYILVYIIYIVTVDLLDLVCSLINWGKLDCFKWTKIYIASFDNLSKLLVKTIYLIKREIY